ncbi:hypothetical protein F5883DRAFT_260228 [Diaporthe sp. PMI_573]|nr:hypothetical protein F5883DRAFT_260228 [Diaporthaceae sp. PMI_573]
MATTITALRARDGFKSTSHVSNRRAHQQCHHSNVVVSVLIWEGIYRLKLHTCPPDLKVGRLPRREVETARSPVCPDHLFVFLQTQFQMLQDVVPNNWIGIPGNTGNPNSSNPYSEKLLAPYACFGIPRRKPIDDEQPGGRLKTTARRFVSSSIASSLKALFACPHLACNRCHRLSISSSKTIRKKKPKSAAFQSSCGHPLKVQCRPRS